MRKRTRRKVWPLTNPISHAITNVQIAMGMDEVVAYVAYVHASMKALVEGRATKQDLQHLTQAHNMVCALMKQGFGEPHADDIEASAAALDAIANRAIERKRILATGPEITTLNFMLQIHDAMMETIDVQEYNIAVRHIVTVIKNGRSQPLNLGQIAA